jgi:hypothetical protein
MTLNVRQAKILRKMLHLGTFTVNEIVSDVEEDPAYVANLITKWKGRWIEERKLRKAGKVGAPPMELFVKAECERQLLEALEPLYLDQERRLSPEVYQFVDYAGSPQNTYREVKVLQQGIFVLSERNAAIDADLVSCDRAKFVELDSVNVASGLATVFKAAHDKNRKPVAIVNVRDNIVHLAVVENGKTSCSACYEPRQRVHGKLLDFAVRHSLQPMVDHLGLAINTFEKLRGKHIQEVFLTGDAPDFEIIQNAVRSTLSRDCSIFDPAIALSIEVEGDNDAGMSGVSCAAEIGYVMRVLGKPFEKYFTRRSFSSNRLKAVKVPTLAEVGKS